jgi:hypothetical protein
MDSDQESKQGTEKTKKPGRSWTERYTGPIRYRRFTDIDAGGRPSIFFKFEDDSALPPEVWDILRSMKRMDRGSAHGGGEHDTGLTFNRSKKHGRVWRLPDHQTGRTAADIIDARLSELAQRIDDEQGKEATR